jgi:hypothetical protein
LEREGPLLESLTRRLAECPADFLAEPRAGSRGTVHVAAVVSDLVRELGGEPLAPQAAAGFQPVELGPHRNRLRLVLVAAWLLHDPWFRNLSPDLSAERKEGAGDAAARASAFLAHGLTDLAALVPAPQCVSDPDRREELARLCLNALGLRPAGETVAQAQDRLTTLSSAERQRVIREAQAAEARARQIREAMARKAAQEAAARYTRE